MTSLSPAIEILLSPKTIRSRANAIYDLARSGATNFKVDEDRIPGAADLVAHVTRENYPDLNIPVHSRWGHFRVGGVDRVKGFEQSLGEVDAMERARAKFDLVVTSVLLDAGAGMKWRFKETRPAKEYSRSEGLAVASYHLFRSGAFSSDTTRPMRADAAGLQELTESQFRRAFQVDENNPLVGLKGRIGLLHSLGRALRARPDYFGGKSGTDARLGNLVDFLFAEAGPRREIAAPRILHAVQVGLGSIWPGRVSVEGFNLGDAWVYPALGQGDEAIVPFHKLSQWLTYSLIEPLEEAGLKVTHPGDLTGLPEYRNGGLFLDLGVISLRDPDQANSSHSPDSRLIVEWRALTVALLDRIAEPVRERLDKTAEEFPLGKVLEGGTWWAGRKLAAEKRTDGGSPLKIDSDGTVF